MFKLSQENDVMKHNNGDLMEQLAMMQKGLATNTVSEIQLREQHNAELSHLRASLESTLARLDRKESECKQLEQRLQSANEEKNAIVHEKNSVIDNLTEHLKCSETQCQQLIQTMEVVSSENAKLKKNNG